MANKVTPKQKEAQAKFAKMIKSKSAKKGTKKG